MNKPNLHLMSTMLGEITANKWKGIPVDHMIKLGPVKLIGQPIKHFDLETWVSKSDCGFSACAVGHACFDPRFQALGLTAEGNKPVLNSDSLGYHIMWNAVEKLFDIKYDTALLLFMPSSYEEFPNHAIPAAQVKCRVDELLSLGEDAFIENHKHHLDVAA